MLSNKIYMRNEIPKYAKFEEIPEEGRHLVNHKRKKLYDYYICDYCGDEIEIKNEKYLMTGGLQFFPGIVTHKRDVTLALCNKCIRNVLTEFEQNLVSQNYNHIPRID